MLSNEENIGKCSIISTCLVMGVSTLHIYLCNIVEGSNSTLRPWYVSPYLSLRGPPKSR